MKKKKLFSMPNFKDNNTNRTLFGVLTALITAATVFLLVTGFTHLFSLV